MVGRRVSKGRDMAISMGTMLAVRGGVYRLLSLAFRQPTAALEEALPRALPILEAALDLSPSLALPEAVEAYRASIGQRANGLGLSFLQELSLEYCRLFVGPGPLACPPYGSVYRDGGVVMGPSTLATISFYEEQSLSVSLKEPPDHIAVELEFMAHLCGEAAQAVDAHEHRNWLMLQKAFLQGHLLAWAPEFARRLVANTSCPLYRALAMLLLAWLPLDHDLVEASLVALEA